MSLDERSLAGIADVPGVQGALLVAVEDGLVIAETVRDGFDSAAAAALSASLWGRMRRAAVEGGQRPPGFLQLEAERGAVLVVPVDESVLAVVVTTERTHQGVLRLRLLDLGGKGGG